MCTHDVLTHFAPSVQVQPVCFSGFKWLYLVSLFKERDTRYNHKVVQKMGNNNRIQDTTCWNGEGHLSVGNRMGGERSYNLIPTKVTTTFLSISLRTLLKYNVIIDVVRSFQARLDDHPSEFLEYLEQENPWNHSCVKRHL